MGVPGASELGQPLQGDFYSNPKVSDSGEVKSDMGFEKELMVDNFLKYARSSGFTVKNDGKYDGKYVRIFGSSGQVGIIYGKDKGKGITILLDNLKLVSYLADNLNKSDLIYVKKTTIHGEEFALFPKLTSQESKLLFDLGFKEQGWTSVAYNLANKSDVEIKNILDNLPDLPDRDKSTIEEGIGFFKAQAPANEKVTQYVVESINWALRNGYAEEIGLTIDIGTNGDFYHGHLLVPEDKAVNVDLNNYKDDFIILYHSRETKNLDGNPNGFKRNFYQDSTQGMVPISKSQPGLIAGVKFADFPGMKYAADINFTICPDGKYTVTLPDGKIVEINIWFDMW